MRSGGDQCPGVFSARALIRAAGVACALAMGLGWPASGSLVSASPVFAAAGAALTGVRQDAPEPPAEKPTDDADSEKPPPEPIDAAEKLLGVDEDEPTDEQMIEKPEAVRELPPPPMPSRVAGPNEVAPDDSDGNPYLVSRLAIEYALPHPNQIPAEQLMPLKVALTPVPEGYIAARRGRPVVVKTIGELGASGPEFLYGSALRAVGQAVVREYNRRGIIVVFVEPSPDDIDALSETQDDLRLDPKTDPMRLVVRLGAVREARTVAAGERRLVGERINNPAHAWVKRRSPLQEPAAAPAIEGAAPARGSLIRRDEIDRFVARASRHPGRRVDIAIAAADADAPGEILLDYLVNENNPWSFYAQLSNTGTKNTDDWRQRLGLSNNQLTGKDDILRLDFITAGFEDTSAIIGSYEFRLNEDTLRGRVYGSASEFTAADVGVGSEDFTGEGWNIGAEAIWNVYQRRELFVDAVGGVRAQHVSVTNEILDVSGKETFVLPYVGLRAERATEASSVSAALTYEFTFDNASPEEVNNLGRADADADWSVLQYDLSTAFFLEPILFPGARSADAGATLAHELAFSARGQWAFGNRLIPNAEDIAGGLYSVRGYPESVVAGDSSLVVSAEYRFHVPRAFGVEPDPTKTPVFGRPFRVRPQQAYGQADWDLILKGFIDVGRVVNSDRRPFESNETLVGTGLGAELQILRNVIVRADWGVALEEVEGGEAVSSGSSRVHLAFTLLF